MKPFQSITVFVEYRYNDNEDGRDDNIPCGRLIRARVAETVTARGGICHAWGPELLAPRRITDRNMMTAHTVCLGQLRGLAREVRFVYDSPLNLEPETYPTGEAA